MSTVFPGGTGPVGTANVSSPTPPSTTDATRAEPAAKPVATKSVAPAAPAGGRSVETRAAAEQPREASRPIAESTTPALSTYQDQSSGRLVVKVFDRTSGQVLAEFPPEKSLQFYPQPETTRPAAPIPSVEVDA